MGNKINKDSSQYGNIFIQTDKPYYFAGDTVTGNVYVNILQPYAGNTVYIKIKGQEMSYF
jgi:hypothetical protein